MSKNLSRSVWISDESYDFHDFAACANKGKHLIYARDEIADIEEGVSNLDIFLAEELNRDIMALKLITKECTALAILPVQTQVTNYAKAHANEIALMARHRDQWEAIDIKRTTTGFEATAHTSFKIQEHAKDQKDPMIVATIRIGAEIVVAEATGKLTITLHRSHLVFEQGVSLKTKQHI